MDSEFCIFLDTTDLAVIQKYLYTIDGITTNPQLVAKQYGAIAPLDVYKKFHSILGDDRLISIQVTDMDNMFENAIEIGNIAPNVLIKLPNTPEGLEVCYKIQEYDNNKILSKRVNMTLTFTPIQAMLAAKVGAEFISVFIGRASDNGIEAAGYVERCVNAIASYPESKILVASIRSLEHVNYALDECSHAITVPPSVMGGMMSNKLTDNGLEQFLSSWQSS